MKLINLNTDFKIPFNVIVDELYSAIDMHTCAGLSKYICEKEGINDETVQFMYDNGIVITDDTIIKYASEFFDTEFQDKFCNNIVNRIIDLMVA